MAKAKFMNGEFSAKFKGKRKFVAEQMEAIKDYAARLVPLEQLKIIRKVEEGET